MAERGRILIVGGAGYVGARLAEALGDYEGIVVTGRTCGADREQWLEAHSTRIRFVAFDSTRQPALPVAGAFDAIINLALPSAASAGRDPEGTQRAALGATSAGLSLLREGRAQRLIHFSTFHVYGPSDRTLFAESDTPNPRHAYGRNHLACERLIAETRTAQPVFVLRATNIVGAPVHRALGDQAKLFFLDLCRQAVEAKSIKLQNDGLSYRDFVSMADVISAVRCLLASDALGGPSPMNLSHGGAQRLDSIAHAIQTAATPVLGVPPTLQFGVGRDEWRAPFAVTNERLRQMGWNPAGGLNPEIAQTLAFFRAHE